MSTKVCPSCGGAALFVPDVFGDCETCNGTGEVVADADIPKYARHGMAMLDRLIAEKAEQQPAQPSATKPDAPTPAEASVKNSDFGGAA
jgi:hypothetical protein